MAKEIIANVEPFETRVAVLEDGQMVNFFIEREIGRASCRERV